MKPFGHYPHIIKVKILWMRGNQLDFDHIDYIDGFDADHAMQRANENWSNASVIVKMGGDTSEYLAQNTYRTI